MHYNANQKLGVDSIAAAVKSCTIYAPDLFNDKQSCMSALLHASGRIDICTIPVP